MTTSSILAIVARYFGLTARQFLRDGRCQHEDIRSARQVAMWLLHWRGLSYPEVARSLGLTDHAACMYGVRRVRESPWLHACALGIDEWLLRTSEQDRMAA